jgi:hypothetical protein
MKFNPIPWLLIAATFGLSAWSRFALVEPTELGFYCDAGGQTFECQVRWIVIQVFSHGLGYVALFLGLLAVFTASGFAGCLAALSGAAGLVLYDWDHSAVAFLLGAMTLARAQFNHCRNQHGAGQQQAG